MVTLRKAAANRFQWPGLAGEPCRPKEVWEYDSQNIARRQNLALQTRRSSSMRKFALIKPHPRNQRAGPPRTERCGDRITSLRIMSTEKEPDVFDDSKKRNTKNYAAMMCVFGMQGENQRTTERARS